VQQNGLVFVEFDQKCQISCTFGNFLSGLVVELRATASQQAANERNSQQTETCQVDEGIQTHQRTSIKDSPISLEHKVSF